MSNEIVSGGGENEENLAFRTVKAIGDFGINGSHVLSSATQLAEEYRNSNAYSNIDECVDGLINWQSGYAFGTGFLTGLGGFATLPIAIPSAMLAAWVIQARLAGAIAKLYGHELNEDRVRTLATLCLLGDAVTDTLKGVGVVVAEKGAVAALERVPGAIFIKINQMVGFRLITKAGETGVVNIIKLIPIVGGIASGAVDLVSTQSVGRIAKNFFRNNQQAIDHRPLGHSQVSTLFAEESTYLGQLGGYDSNPGANSIRREDHFDWASGQHHERVTEDLVWKYCHQYDRQTRISAEDAHRFYGEASARLASYGIDLGNPGANGREAGPHTEWAKHQSHDTLRGGIADKVRILMAGAAVQRS